MITEQGRRFVGDTAPAAGPNPDSMRPRARSRVARGVARFTMALVLVLLGTAVALAGCGRKAASKQDEAAQQLRAQQLIDSGNEAYRTGDYRLAARRYAAAAVVKKDDPAAYFGMGMALSKLGRDEEARTAYQRSRELARPQAVLDFPGTRGGGGGAPAETIP